MDLTIANVLQILKDVTRQDGGPIINSTDQLKTWEIQHGFGTILTVTIKYILFTYVNIFILYFKI